MTQVEAVDRAGSFVSHAYVERLVDLGEIRMNYATAGRPDRPALLLIPGQGQSWWSYERCFPLLVDQFQVYAVDLRGQGRSTWTPGRYTLDNFGNDLVRFIDLVIDRPTIVSGHSSGGVLAAWLAAYAKPGQIRATIWEDPPLFSSETNPSCGPSIRQAAAPIFAAWHKWLGDQWSIGDWDGMRKALRSEIPPILFDAFQAIIDRDRPPQGLREYDPEWGRAFVTGSVGVGCDHATMLSQVRGPVLFTHHSDRVDEETGLLLGASSALQAQRVRQLVEATGQSFTMHTFPDITHSMHNADAELFARTVTDWATTLP